MNQRFVLIVSFGLVFTLGFATGALWRSVPTVSATTAPTATDLADTEDRMAKALEDPDFKRIHDHLNRERPMQLDIPMKPETPQEWIPMESRPPVKFSN